MIQSERNRRKKSRFFKSKLEVAVFVFSVTLILLAVILVLFYLWYATLKPQVCESQACIQASAKLLDTIDQKIDPCNDFYQFACGTYFKTAYEDDKTGEVFMITKKAKKQYEHIFKEALKDNDSRAYRNLKLLYGACMNESEITTNGVKNMRAVLEQFGGWPILMDKWDDDQFDWINATVMLRKFGYTQGNLIDFNIHEDTINTQRHYLILDPPIINDLGLKSDLENYITSIAILFGAQKSKALQDSRDIHKLMSDIYELRKKYPQDINVVYISLKEVQIISPQINWINLINSLIQTNLFDEDSTVIFRIKDYFRDLNELMKNTPKRVQSNYMLWETIREMIPFLPTEFRDRHDFYSKKLHKYTSSKLQKAAKHRFRNSLVTKNVTKTPVKLQRSKLCMDEVEKLLPAVADRIYGKKYAPPKVQQMIIEMITNIKLEFKRLLLKNNWMDQETKKYALEKFDVMGSFIGGDFIDTTEKEIDDFMDFSNVNLDSYVNNYISLISKAKIAADYFYFNELNRTTIQAEKFKFHFFVSEVNAFYSGTNLIVVPAALMQDMLFNQNFPNYLNYGGIGHLIGHEITHAFTANSNGYGKNGEPYDWWSNTSKINYANVTNCLINSYEEYTEQTIGIKLNGKLTLDENIADLTGTLVAHSVYNKLYKNEASLIGLENYSARQLLWISTARFYCDPQEKKFMKDIDDVHSINSFRAIGPFRNIKEFAEDFNCPIGSQMNPVKRCDFF